MNKISLTAIVAAFVFTAFNLKAQDNKMSSPQQNKASSSTHPSNVILTYKIINASNNTFGYDIYADKKPMIHQPSIPALPGSEGFKTKDAAKKTALYVIGKIKRGEMPPSVSVDEMRTLKVIQ